jgi:hypothetical protein
MTGTVNYWSGVVSLVFASAPANHAAITADYSRVSVLTLSNTLLGATAAELVVLQNGVPLVHGTGSGKYTVVTPVQILLGTAANGTDLYTVIYAQSDLTAI